MIKTYIDIDNWNRKQHYEHFKSLKDPYFGLVVNVDTSVALKFSKKKEVSFFATYLFACMKAINAIDNFSYRLEGNKVISYDTINASATILKPDNTFAFSYINFSEDFDEFNANFLAEKKRIHHTKDLFPPINDEACIYCSALPWLHFTGHKEPVSGIKNMSIPEVSFGKAIQSHNQLKMPVSIHVNHALVDGYHVGQFFEIYQHELNNLK